MSELSEKYEVKIADIRKQLPDRNDFVKLWVYKNGKMIDEFQLQDWEAHMSLLEETKVNANQIFRDQFAQYLINAGYGVEFVIDEKKFEPKMKEYAKLEINLLKQFKADLRKEHDYLKLNDDMLEKAFKMAKNWRKDGGFEFIEEAYVEIVELVIA